MKLLFMIRLKLYPVLHRLTCDGSLGVFVPTEEYMKESVDTEAYMLCQKCNKKYHLVNLTPENESSEDVQ